ncbi:hypothetical protein [Micromonospora sp. CPCC 205546]|uniref:hypothetical protein n=1 Tax=Micromonospora sp. CPCC 205546 TaxID=3122397 RepID=UPI003FA5F8EB
MGASEDLASVPAGALHQRFLGWLRGRGHLRNERPKVRIHDVYGSDAERVPQQCTGEVGSARRGVVRLGRLGRAHIVMLRALP